MSQTVFKVFYVIIAGLTLAVSSTAFAAEAEDIYTVKLENGDELTGHLLTETFSITTPYTFVAVEKHKILEVRINDAYQHHDVIILKEGGSLEGTLEEPEFSLKTASGEIITLEKNQCKKIILKSSH